MNLANEFDQLENVLSGAIEKAHSGKIVNLDPFAKKLNDLCHKATQQTPETAHAIKPIMARIIERLDELESVLKSKAKK
jgi:hypothetical protein